MSTKILDHTGLSTEMALRLYLDILKPRLIEEKMLILLRQGKISKWFSGIGQEAISIGVTSALTEDEYILPMHRNLGVFTKRGIPLSRLFAQWQGKKSGFTKGRDRSFHFGTQEFKIIGMISHLGPQLGVADGIALAHKLKNEQQVVAVFTGEGGTSEGDFHEALNVAAVWDLPVLFCIENNGYGLSTPTDQQYKCANLVDRAIGYGIEGHIIDGNNVIEVYQTVKKLAEDLRVHPRPILLEFKTFRMRGHEEASGTKYVPNELMDFWSQKDPVQTLEDYLIAEGIIDETFVATHKKEIKEEINAALALVAQESLPEANLSEELKDVYAPFEAIAVKPNPLEKENVRFIDAIADGLNLAMNHFPKLVLMGQDIAGYGGVFKITEGFVEKYGTDRVRNTPICESAIIEAGMGLAIAGMKAVVEMQFADFITSGFNPVVNYLAKSYYRWGQPADVVIRMPCGGGVGAGPFHSQTNEAWFTHTPGLQVVYPAFPADAKGLLISAIESPNPVLFFEHKALYRTIREDVAVGYYNIPIGKASVLRTGGSATLITYGAGVHWALDLLKTNPDLDVEVIDLRTLQPLDKETLYASVKKTGKALILTEDTQFGSIASDIAALLAEHCFEYLDAPIHRVCSLDSPIPFSSKLEEQFSGKSRLEASLRALISY